MPLKKSLKTDCNSYLFMKLHFHSIKKKKKRIANVTWLSRDLRKKEKKEEDQPCFLYTQPYHSLPTAGLTSCSATILFSKQTPVR